MWVPCSRQVTIPWRFREIRRSCKVVRMQESRMSTRRHFSYINRKRVIQKTDQIPNSEARSHPPTSTSLSPSFHIFLSSHTHSPQTKSGKKNEPNSLRHNRFHHPRHRRQPRPLKILPPREQPVFFKRSRKHQRTKSVRERFMAKDQKIWRCVHGW